MKILVAGSRGVTDYEVVRRAFIASGFWNTYKRTIEVVSGTARGVDRLGEEFAEKNGLLVHRFPADWETYGKRAGYIRNAAMAEFSDALIVIILNDSRGSENMLQCAMKKGMPFYVKRIYT